MAGRRQGTVTQQRPAVDFAAVVRALREVGYRQAERLVLVRANLNTHKPAALSQAFAPALARSLIERLERHHTPKQGRGLTRAEIERSVLSRHCLDRRLPDANPLTPEVTAWERARNAHARPVNWRFPTPDARSKLKRL